jgi:hypothetical protein
LFLYDYHNGLYGYDISDPLTIVQNSFYELQNYSIRDIIIKENIMFLLDGKGLFILNISNLALIQSISNYTVTDFYVTFESLVIQDNFAYLHNSFIAHFEPRTPIFILNITNIESPFQIFPVKGENFLDWLERILNTMLAIVITVMVLPPLIVAIIIILAIHFYRKEKKSVDEIKINNNL